MTYLGDTILFVNDPAAGANVVELSPAEITQLPADQQRDLDRGYGTPKTPGVHPAIIALGAIAAITFLA